MKRMSAIAALTLLALMLLAPPQATAAQERQRCFAEVPFCIKGQLLEYWERNGGLPVFGYPIGDEIPNEIVEEVWVGRTQWFERDRLELHSGGVLSGRLGVLALELQGRSWWDFAPFVGELPRGCAYFAETRHSVCEPFLSYWNKNGGLARFGYPVSQPMTETIDGWSGPVQYFERRRMEHHIELRGTRYEVLLGLLGRDLYAAAPPQLCTTPIVDELRASLAAEPALRENLGCPTVASHDAPAASQPFQSGEMFWFDLGGGGRKIYRVWRSLYQPGHPRVFQIHDDTWTAAEPVSGGLTPPAGMFEPQRGFGKVWRSSKFVREDLGWATAPEQPARAVVQQFGSGATAFRLKDSGTVYVLGPGAGKVSVLSYK